MTHVIASIVLNKMRTIRVSLRCPRFLVRFLVDLKMLTGP
jgi:hypothetical protein